MASTYRPGTQAEMLRNHEKDIANLKNRGAPLPLIGQPMNAGSVAGTGIAVGSAGQVVLANASGTLDINGIFTAAFDDYLIYLDIYNASATSTISMQMRTNAGPVVAASYRWGQDNKTFGGTSAYTTGVAQTNFAVVNRFAGGSGGKTEMTIFNPCRTDTDTMMQGQTTASDGTTLISGWLPAFAALYTGIRLVIGSGTVNGVLRCYGINQT